MEQNKILSHVRTIAWIVILGNTFLLSNQFIKFPFDYTLAVNLIYITFDVISLALPVQLTENYIGLTIFWEIILIICGIGLLLLENKLRRFFIALCIGQIFIHLYFIINPLREFPAFFDYLFCYVTFGFPMVYVAFFDNPRSEKTV